MDESIKQYGNLTETELLEFLNAIEDEDEDLQRTQEEASESIAMEEAQSNLSESIAMEEAQSDLSEKENRELEAQYGEDAWRKFFANTDPVLYGRNIQRKANFKSAEADIQRRKNLKAQRLEIQRLAFNQEFIALSYQIEAENIKLLISLLVREHTRMIEKYEAYINKRLTNLLSPFIPIALRRCKKLYPDSIRICPGFLYKASDDYGQGYTFWAEPDIPYYFIQNTEQKILIENKSSFLINVDIAIKLYHEHTKKRADKELKYASMLYRKKVHTYFDLLKLNPFWFELLYNDLLSKASSIL